ncbi:MAG: hypothetical protein CME70_22785 [Halobacteriovorax sp.]|nr:hypothetical protein [Halobacteriovorax sp.]|tara:strand:- start:21952 stop:22551 length:600 start_codon:yes stop_codon:yes gene_type:complete
MGRKAGNKGVDLEHDYRMTWAMELWPYFKQHGLKGFNMNEVAKTLGKSKTTVYKYFQTREDILELILSKVLLDLSAFEEILLDKKQNYIERYEQAIEVLSVSLGGISTSFLLDLKRYHPKLWESINGFKLYSLGVLKSFYREGKRKKILGNTSVELLVTGDEIFLSALLEPEFLHKNKISLESGLRAYFENKMFGMLKR